MDLVHQIMMMMIVKMTMTHPVLVDHLDQDGPTIVAGHPDRTIVEGHLVQPVQVDLAQVEVLRVQVEVLRVLDQESPR